MIDVLPGDAVRAQNLRECAELCLGQARKAMHYEDTEQVDWYMKEFERCRKELDELMKAKQEQDQLKQLVEDLRSKGVNAKNDQYLCK